MAAEAKPVHGGSDSDSGSAGAVVLTSMVDEAAEQVAIEPSEEDEAGVVEEGSAEKAAREESAGTGAVR